MKKHEEQIGVRLPDGRRYMATVLAGPLESDEDILVRMTKDVGTIFNVNAQKLLVVSINPFRLKNITEAVEDAGDEDEPKPRKRSERPERVTPTPAPVVVAPVVVAPVVVAPVVVAPVEPVSAIAETVDDTAPKSERRQTTSGPAVGERWRPKDPRRIASFVVKDVQGDVVLTDDGRSIALNRFSRYVRVEEDSDVKSHG